MAQIFGRRTECQYSHPSAAPIHGHVEKPLAYWAQHAQVMISPKQRLNTGQVLWLGNLNLNLLKQLLLLGTGADLFIRHAATLKKSRQGVQCEVTCPCASIT